MIFNKYISRFAQRTCKPGKKNGQPVRIILSVQFGSKQKQSKNKFSSLLSAAQTKNFSYPNEPSIVRLSKVYYTCQILPGMIIPGMQIILTFQSFLCFYKRVSVGFI